MNGKPVLEVDDLSVAYVTRKGLATAVDRVSFSIGENEIVGLVGESGCGKSTMASAIMRLLGEGAYVTGGAIRVLGQDVYALKDEALRQFRWTQMAMVFQGAMNVLNPVKTVESQIIDTLQAHRPDMSKQEARNRAEELFRLVRIDPKRLTSFPHELSGGMRQRVVIAIAIALQPKFIIMDEPTTALDVIVQKSILEQIMELRDRIGFSMLFISHDFNLVEEISDRVGVMYAGRLVEMSNSSHGTESAVRHPYTQGLIRAIPKLTDDDEEIQGIPGSPPSVSTKPSGCAFHPRCPVAKSVCRTNEPMMKTIEGNRIECHLSEDELRSMTYAER